MNYRFHCLIINLQLLSSQLLANLHNLKFGRQDHLAWDTFTYTPSGAFTRQTDTDGETNWTQYAMRPAVVEKGPSNRIITFATVSRRNGVSSRCRAAVQKFCYYAFGVTPAFLFRLSIKVIISAFTTGY